VDLQCLKTTAGRTNHVRPAVFFFPLTDHSIQPAYDPAMVRHPGKRILKWLGIIAIVLVMIVAGAGLGFWYWGGPYAQRVIHAKLQAIVSGNFSARLEMGNIEYVFPFGVNVNDVALVAEQGELEVKIASFRQLRLKLTELPFGDGPLRIESVEIDAPTVRVVQTQLGIVGQKGLVRSEEERRQRKAPKLLQVFVLKHLRLDDARIVYEDRVKPDQTPLVWRDLNVLVNSQPTGPSYDFNLTANSGNLAAIAAKGTIDLDTLVVDLEKMQIQTTITSSQERSPLPPQVTSLLSKYQVAGVASVDLSGNFHLIEPVKSSGTLSLNVSKAHAHLAPLPDPLEDLDLAFTTTFSDGEVDFRLEQLNARFGNTGTSVQPFRIHFTPATLHWTASPIRLAIAYEPTELSREFLSQPATLFVVAKPEQDLADQVVADPLAMSVVLDGSSLTLRNLNEEIKLTSTISVTSEAITFRPSRIAGFAGETQFEGGYVLKKGDASLRAKMLGLSLAPLKVFITPDTEKQMKGKLSGDLALTLQNNDWRSVSGSGLMRVRDGEFARVPVLSDVASFLHIGQSLFVAESAWADFKVEQQKLIFRKVGASTNAIRVRGEGEMGFDEQLDLRLYVIGAGDWGKSIQSTGIPVISDVGGALAGGAQGLIRGVTNQFTSVRVTGSIDKPKITPNPAPVITDQVKKLFEE
jgi:hypothetical protein